MKRIATALVLVPIAVWLILWAPEWALIAALVVVGALALREFYQITNGVALGVIYIFGPFACAVLLHRISHHWLMLAMLLCWVGDTAAMYIGKNFGKHKLAKVSPNKTWEGAIASVVGAVIAALIYAHYLIPQSPLPTLLLIATVGNIAGQFGDLAESAIKRKFGVKDSGASLPGHGGWLDRIDALLFAIPAVYLLVWVSRAIAAGLNY
jgi:phosphatidate cytidylyltransferase